MSFQRDSRTRLREWLAAVEDVVTPPHWIFVFIVVWIMYLTLLEMSIRTLVGSEKLARLGNQVLLEFI